MIETITAVNQAVNQFIWGVPAMVCIIGVGLLLSVRTGFLQIRKFPYAIKTTIGRMFRKKDASDGAMTPFQAVCTALAGTVGTGNIAGVAGAIAIGGPGAVFWMWCSALLGMCTKFAEVTLAVHYRERSEAGEWVGGPMYYIKNGLSKHWQFLAVLYSLFGVLTVFGTGNATQVNTIVAAIDTALLEYGVVGGGALSTLNLVVGIAVAMLVAMVLLGGIKRIGSVSEKLVPFMALFYIVLSVGVMVLNFERLPYVFESIIAGAFNPAAFTGGTIGSLFVSMQKGVSRGIFSNEAGLGTGSIAHACADTKKPAKQGMFGIFEVFADTIVICTLTALVILCSGTPVSYGDWTDEEEGYRYTWVNKFAGKWADNKRYFISDLPLYRYAEALLFKAEIENERGNVPTALAYLNRVAKRAYGIDNYYTASDYHSFKESLMTEYLKEFAGEGKSWWNYIRLGYAFTKIESLRGRQNETNILLWPITTACMNENPNIRQTVGYN